MKRPGYLFEFVFDDLEDSVGELFFALDDRAKDPASFKGYEGR